MASFRCVWTRFSETNNRFCDASLGLVFQVWIALGCSGYLGCLSGLKKKHTHTPACLSIHLSRYLSIHTKHAHMYVCMFVQVPVYTHFYTVCMNRIITIYSSGLSYILSHPIPFPFFASPKQTLYLPLKTCSLCARSLPLPSITLFSQRKNYSIPSDTS